MNNRNLWTIACVCVATIFAHMIINYQKSIWILEQQLSFSEKNNQIEAEQIRDLMYELEKNRAENTRISTTQYISGVLDSLNRKEYFNEIWHAGYDRGSEVQSYADSVIPKKTTLTSDRNTSNKEE